MSEYGCPLCKKDVDFDNMKRYYSLSLCESCYARIVSREIVKGSCEKCNKTYLIRKFQNVRRSLICNSCVDDMLKRTMERQHKAQVHFISFDHRACSNCGKEIDFDEFSGYAQTEVEVKTYFVDYHQRIAEAWNNLDHPLQCSSCFQKLHKFEGIDKEEQITLRLIEDKTGPIKVIILPNHDGFNVEKGKVCEISIGSRNLYRFPKIVEKLSIFTSLKRLDLSYNKLNSLPQLNAFRSLKEISIDGNSLNKFHINGDNFPELEALYFSENLQDIDIIFQGSFPRLRTLFLFADNLLEIPESIRRLSQLKFLNLEMNFIEHIPEQLYTLSSLEKLDLSDNKITYLSESIANLKMLKDLDISNNKLRNLPDSIGRLKELEDLALYQNEIERLPESIGGLQSLRDISLWENKLKRIPESIGRIPHLKIVSLSNNNLHSIPESLSLHPTVKYLYLEGNPGFEFYSDAEVSKVRWIEDNDEF